MAMFSHNGRDLSYLIQFTPFSHDLILLQGSRFTMDYWRPTLKALQEQSERPATMEQGRVVLCDWFASGLATERLAEDLASLIQALGLHDLHVVASDDAVDVVRVLERKIPSPVKNTLLYTHSVPRGEALADAIREFVRI
jgi:hypothetical protein